MKNKHFYSVILSSLFLIFIFSIKALAFTYTVKFTASGASKVDRVEVKNLTQGGAFVDFSTYNYQLTPVETVNDNDEIVSVYPNPIQDKATVSYYSSDGGNTTINVFGVDGKNLIGMTKYLNIGVNKFQIKLPKGIYVIIFNENGVVQTKKILSQSDNIAQLEYVDNENISINTYQKAKAAFVPMKCNLGDVLLYKGYSGNNVNIVTSTVTSDQTINFDFVECKDGDGNYYSTVKIGTQVWMAENLRTTKYINRSSGKFPIITNCTISSSWKSNIYGAYCRNTSLTDNAYGYLYNYKTLVATAGVLSPDGWHIPTKDEVIALSNFVGVNSSNKLKENGTDHWLNSTTGTNEYGFTALPGGNVDENFNFTGERTSSYWWTSTAIESKSNSGFDAYYFSILNSEPILQTNFKQITYNTSNDLIGGPGLSVRCIKN